MFFKTMLADSLGIIKCQEVLLCVIILCVLPVVPEHRDAAGLWFKKEPSDVVVAVGGSTVLSCEASGPQKPSISWRTAQGEPVGNQHRWHTNDGSLSISQMKEDEAYRCVASLDSIGKIVSRIATVSVANLSEIEGPQSLHVYPGQTAHFTCHATGKPRPKVAWLKDDRPLVLDETRMVVLPSGSLEIDEVQLSDTGSYRCNVSSLDLLRLSDKAFLTVSQDLEGASRSMAPEFIATPRSTIAIEGTNVTLDCAANGNPRPVISWLKDGASIDMAFLDSRYRVVGTGSLQISNVIESDTGNYQCRAGNREDSVDHQATLQIQVAPRFTKKPSSLTAVVKSDIELECEVYAKPEPSVVWLKNGDPISQKNHYLQVVNGNNLRILGVISLDYGIFQCVASNPAGNIQAAALLSVKQQEVEDEVTIAPVEMSGRSETGAPRQLEAIQVQPRLVSLRWKPPATSHGEIISYSVFYSEETSMRERVVNTSRSRLEEANIAGLKPNTTYTFRVAALSRSGLGEASIPLSIVTTPELSVPGPPRSVSAVPTTVSLSVSWQPPAVTNGPIRLYRLYYYESETSEEHHVDTMETEYLVIGLKKYTEYIVWVIAHNDNGAGASSDELSVRTLSDQPSGSPTNITLEIVSSTSVIVRWDPPPKDECNGVITGYKLRYRVRDRRGKTETVTTGGNRRYYLLENLDKSSVYQVRLWALNVNGSGPPTEWVTLETYESDLDETVVPGAPTAIRAKATSDSINVMWSPPKDTNIMVRYYTISWGKGAPGGKTERVDGKQRYFVIKNLEPNSDYVISLEAQNEVGNGPPIYENVRTHDESAETESSLALIPPVGLKTNALSSTTIVLFWTDSMLGIRQEPIDQRYYVVRYNQYHQSDTPVRYRFHNSSVLSYMIEDLKPFTTYEFAVKVVKGKKESAWSMVATNTTKEAPPASPPRDLTVNNEEPGAVALTWLPPKLPNGIISNYIVSYTTDLMNKENNWIMEMVKGDKLSTTIRSLQPSTTYYFHVKAKNSMGYSSTPVVSITTLSSSSVMSEKGIKGKLGGSGMMYVVIVCAAALVTIIGVVAVVFVCCRRPPRQSTPDRGKKGYKASTSGIKPPDLWIHHDQMELKNVEKNQDSGGGGGAGGGGTLPRESSSLAEKHHPQYMSSQCQPLLAPEERTSTLRRTYKHKPITLPIDNSHFREPVATATPIGGSSQTPAVEARPLYPRTQYSISRAHVTIDPNVPESPYATQQAPGTSGTSSMPYEPAPPPIIYSSSSGGASGGGTGTGGSTSSGGDPKRVGSHPLKSFSVPAPPSSAPTTPQQRHVVTVRPQGASPYKKSGAYSTTSPLPKRQEQQELPKIQASYSTEELNQEMANLEGLMKDLNAITASQFQC